MWRTIKAYLLYTWAGLHRYFGNQNNLNREHRRAVHYFTRAYETDPRLRRARLARAVILWRELDRVDEAITDLDYLLEEDPTYGPARFNRALAYQQEGRFVQALADMQAYLQLASDDEYRPSAIRMAGLLKELIAGEAER